MKNKLIFSSSGPQRQKGVSMLKVILVVGALGCIAMFALKIVPAYMDYLTMTSVVDKYLESGSVTLKSVDDVERDLDKRFNINGLRSVRPNDIKVSKNKGVMVVDIDYFVDREVYKNDYSTIGVSIHFEKTITSK